MIKILELFGGIGAPRKALENLFNNSNLKFIDYVEYDQAPVELYNLLYNHNKKPESVVGYNLKPDVLIHGSPCQDFSVAGKGLGGFLGSETRSSLMWETIRIIEDFGKWKPKVVIWENVKGVLNKTRKCKACKEIVKWNETKTQPCKCGKTVSTNFDNFNLYLNSLTELGYKNNFQVLNGIDFGIPQKRERIFVVSILETAQEFLHFDFNNLKKRPLRKLEDFLEKEVDISYYLTQKSMMKAVLEKKIKIINNVVQTITTKQWRWNNAGVIKIPLYSFNQENYTHITFGNEKAISTITAEGANSRIKIFVPKKYDELPVFELQDGKQYHLRVLTQREAWRLMGFEDSDFNKVENMGKTILYKAAGNSIIVNVLEAIFQELLCIGERKQNAKI